jgi:hypothetical protein
MNAVDKLYYRLHPAKFFADIGSRLKRGRIVPDPWQKRVMECRSKRILMVTSRQAGKTSVMAALALWKALLFDDQLVLLVSPTERQSKILFARVARFYQAFGGTVDTTSARRMGFEFENGSQIEALPGSAATIQGFSADLVIVDEAGAVDDEVVTVLRPSLAVTKGTLVMGSKPYGQRGIFYREWSEGEGWYREEVPATSVPRISPEFLEEEKAHMMEHEYQREYNCVFDDLASSSVFGPKELFERNTVDLPPLWDKEGQYIPLRDTAEDQMELRELKQREAELTELLGQSKANKRKETIAGDDDLVWRWEDWQR